jgi:hypothetical protein
MASKIASKVVAVSGFQWNTLDHHAQEKRPRRVLFSAACTDSQTSVDLSGTLRTAILERAMGIEPTREVPPGLKNKRFGAMADSKCD